MFRNDTHVVESRRNQPFPRRNPGHRRTCEAGHAATFVIRRARPATGAGRSACWLEPGQTARVCTNVAITQTTFVEDNLNCAYSGALQKEARCGCGLAYKEGRSWSDLFDAESFYGNRLTYYSFLSFGVIAAEGRLPSAAERAKLATLPTTGWHEAAGPSEGPERSPVATDPNFISQ